VVARCRRGLGSVRVSLAAAPWALECVLRGTAGTIRVDLARQRALLARASTGGNRRLALVRTAVAASAQTTAGMLERLAGKASGRLRGYPGMRTLIARWYGAIRHGEAPPVPFRDGAAVALALEDVRAALSAHDRAPEVVPLRGLA